mmetsp:Transcript_69620/g.115658  ORF Transcript_69620/g.115658 Transcript_69620/m.115658 type:complete len:314 (-) Transcript_69620:234-1175(-)
MQSSPCKSRSEMSAMRNPQLQNFLAGGTAGIVSRTAVAPLERVKILFQVQALSAQGKPLRHTSIWHSLTAMYRVEGALGMWKGNGANCIRVFPSSAIQFSCYAEIKRILFGEDELTPEKRLVAGALAGVVAQTATYPLDFIRARMTTDMAGQYSSGTWAALGQVVRAEGPLALWRGITPSIVGAAPYVGIDFAVYDTLRPLVPRKPGSDEPSVGGKLIAGAVAGSLGQTAAYPLDTVRRILQVQDVKVKHAGVRYTGMIDCVVGIIRRDGIGALYAGLTANYLKVVPAVSISFVVYEACKDALVNSFGVSTRR